MKVFLSYAAEDEALARELAARLSQCGLEPWLAEQEVLPGENLATRVGQALEEAEAMVVLLSPASARSRFVREEISYALGSIRFADRVVPVMVEHTDQTPWVLRNLQIIKNGHDVEQLSRQIVDRLKPVTP